jgi:hypothetical protein
VALYPFGYKCSSGGKSHSDVLAAQAALEFRQCAEHLKDKPTPRATRFEILIIPPVAPSH